MIKTIANSVLLAAVLCVVACAASPGHPPANATADAATHAAPAPRCRIANNSDAVNAIIAGAPEANTNANLTAHADALTALALASGNGATAQSDGVHEVACRRISLQAYQALLRVPGHEAAALQGLRDQSTDGSFACTAIGASADLASQRDCDFIQLWRRTIDMAQALQNLRDLRAAFASSPADSDLPDPTWQAIGVEIDNIRNNIANNWPQVAEGREQKTRLACDFYQQMVSLSPHRAVSGSDAYLRRYYEPYTQTIGEAAIAIGVTSNAAACADATSQACTTERVNELASVCIRLGGR